MVSISPSAAIGRPIVLGVLCALISVPIAYVALDAYVVLTVSIGDTRLISHLIEGALYVVGATAFGSGFVSGHLARASLGTT